MIQVDTTMIAFAFIMMFLVGLGFGLTLGCAITRWR